MAVNLQTRNPVGLVSSDMRAEQIIRRITDNPKFSLCKDVMAALAEKTKAPYAVSRISDRIDFRNVENSPERAGSANSMTPVKNPMSIVSGYELLFADSVIQNVPK